MGGIEGAPVDDLQLNLEEDPAKTKNMLAPDSSAFGIFLSPLHNPKPAQAADSSFPLILQMPNGGRRHLEVPHSATIRDLKHRVLHEGGKDVAEAGLNMQSLGLTFGGADISLNDDMPLSAFNIPSAYENAGSLLWTVEEAQLDTEQKASAVQSIAAVVQNISAGVDDADKLAEVAASPVGLSSENQAKLANADPQPAKEDAPGRITLPPITAPITPGLGGGARVSPPELLNKLTNKLPSVFTPAATETLTTTWASRTPMAPPSSATWRLTSAGLEPRTSNAQGPQGEVSEAQTSRTEVPDPSEQTATESNHVGPNNSWLDDLSKTWTEQAKAAQDDSEEASDREDDEPASEPKNDPRSANNSKPPSGLVTGEQRIPKKRGRKPKNPHLTEEERKEQRKAQNRESAKKSRQRKKVMSADYEGKMDVLRRENDNLHEQIQALNHRLSFLQQVLTVSIKKN